MKCPNCNSSMTCSCQKKIASDGKKVCSNCISKYEASLINSKSTTYNVFRGSDIKKV